MAEGAFDHVVVGSSPLAGLIAGLLVVEHKRRVCLVAETFSPFRLQRGFDLSVAVLTRPDTLGLLQRLAGETEKLIGGLGKGLVDRIDPLFIAETPASIAALAHFRHVAQALGHTVEPAAMPAGNGSAVQLRDIASIARARFAPALEAWLAFHEVRRLDPAETTLTLRRDGGVRIASAGREVEATHAVFADDAALLAHLPEEQRDPVLRAGTEAALLIEAGKPLAAPYMGWLDRRISLAQEGRGSVAAWVAGDPITAAARLGASLPRGGTLRRAGETRYGRLASLDGAPYIARAKGTRAVVIAALGVTGSFFAPALARFVAEASSPDEAAWLTSRGSPRGNLRLEAAEFAA